MKYKILTLSKDNIKNFAKERNDLMNKNDSQWFLFLDSDEKISKELYEEIKKIVPGKYQSFVIKRTNYFLNLFVGQDKIIRLVKKGSGKWVRAVHEVFVSNEPIGKLEGSITHYTAQGLSGYIRKINKYSTIHSIENKKEKKNSNLFKIIFFPIFKFFQTLFKSKNTVFSIMQSFHSFLAWSKQYLNEEKK